jgi:hypothetical protein
MLYITVDAVTGKSAASALRKNQTVTAMRAL